MVTYADGNTSAESCVLKVISLPEEQAGIVAASTPFHPVDYQWPDQPADKGFLIVDGLSVPVRNCVCGVRSHETNEYFTGRSIPVKKGTEGWDFFVVHVVSAADLHIEEGSSVQLRVDAEYRHQLDMGHTACHLTALALNKCLTPFWNKSPGRSDAMDNPDFDQLAIQQSLIVPFGSQDDYRLGKSLRKKGLRCADVLAALPELEKEVNATLSGWLGTGALITMKKEGQALLDRRYWHCDFSDGEKVIIPCGGTHVNNLDVYQSLTVALQQTGDQALRVYTKGI